MIAGPPIEESHIPQNLAAARPCIQNNCKSGANMAKFRKRKKAIRHGCRVSIYTSTFDCPAGCLFLGLMNRRKLIRIVTHLHSPHIEPSLKWQITAQCTARSVCAEVEVYEFRAAVEGVVYDRSE